MACKVVLPTTYDLFFLRAYQNFDQLKSALLPGKLDHI